MLKTNRFSGDNEIIWSIAKVTYHAAVPGWEEEAEKATESKVAFLFPGDHDGEEDARIWLFGYIYIWSQPNCLKARWSTLSRPSRLWPSDQDVHEIGFGVLETIATDLKKTIAIFELLCQSGHISWLQKWSLSQINDDGHQKECTSHEIMADVKSITFLSKANNQA